MPKRVVRMAVCTMVLILGITGDAIAGQAGQADPTPGAIVFLNRQGGTYRPGFDSPINNTSPIVAHTSLIPPFAGDDDDWATVVRHTRTMFAPFDVTIVEQEPPPTAFYIEVAVGGMPQAIGRPFNVLGVAAAYCSPALRSIVYVFSDNAAGDNVLIAETIAHEVGHAFSLDHEYLCKDPMTYLIGCGEKRFQNRTTSCGENGARPCYCTGGEQNSFRTMVDAFGSRDGSIRPLRAEAGGELSQPAWVCDTPHPRRQ